MADSPASQPPSGAHLWHNQQPLADMSQPITWLETFQATQSTFKVHLWTANKLSANIEKISSQPITFPETFATY
jgi:hypothetical protein